MVEEPARSWADRQEAGIIAAWSSNQDPTVTAEGLITVSPATRQSAARFDKVRPADRLFRRAAPRVPIRAVRHDPPYPLHRGQVAICRLR